MSAFGQLFVAALLAGPAAAAQSADDFFDGSALHEIRLTLRDADWSALRAHFAENTYYPCEFNWRGMQIENAGVRSRGAGSRNPVKPGLHIDFNRYDPEMEFLGLKSVDLKNAIQDASMLRERLSMTFFARMGLPASRAAHARLYVNGRYMGLYTVVEPIDKRYLKRYLGEDGGWLYEYKWKGTYHFEYRGADVSQYVPLPFQPQTHEKSPGHEPLVAMIRTMNQASDADFARAMSEYLDLRLFMTHVAIENFLAELDGIVGFAGLANFDLYRYEGNNRFQFLVWDKDNAFSDFERPIFQDAAPHVLMRRTLEVPALRTAYLEALLRSAALAGGPGGWLEREIAREYAQIRAAAREDTLKQCSPEFFGTVRNCSNEEFEEAVERLLRFVRYRSEFVLREVAAAGREPHAGVPRLNDGGAVNAAGGSGIVAPGSLVTLYGDFGAVPALAAPTPPLPEVMGGVMVLINGFVAPLIWVSPGQITAQAPWEVAPGTLSVTVLVNGVPGNTIVVEAAPVSPGVFAVAHADGRPVSSERPAAAGDVLIVYATGLGPVNRAVRTGQPAPANPPAEMTGAVSVTIGGRPARVEWAGLTPGLAGVYQVNFRMPEGDAAGTAATLVVTVGGRSSIPLAVPSR